MFTSDFPILTRLCLFKQCRSSRNMTVLKILQPVTKQSTSALWSSGSTLQAQFVFHPPISVASLPWVLPISVDIILQMAASVIHLGFTQYYTHHQWLLLSPPHIKDLSKTFLTMDSLVFPLMLHQCKEADHQLLCLRM